jgi:hypothetical protein
VSVHLIRFVEHLAMLVWSPEVVPKSSITAMKRLLTRHACTLYCTSISKRLSCSDLRLTTSSYTPTLS